ncbi:hypothetical protein LSH36_15g04004 [Paralvinella palmiformis]|uniref:Kinesin motor domain-containing protein n=1 Tax=Paralvinella palmiformis TaxID=53620 RepID=A0AAD9KC53_9ANNE|nr:hypothetical protein LSH36_15g04004 [Paralvinella palmiformis]
MAESANIHGSGASQVRQSQPRNSLHAKRERNRSLPNPDSHPDNSDLDINVSVMSNGEDVQENSRTPRQDSTHRQISKDTPRHTTIQKSSDFNKNQLQRYPSEPRLPASALSNTLSSGLTSEVSGEDEDCINVVVRVRPLSQQEVQRHDKSIIQFPGDGAIWIDSGVSTKSFTFNVMFEPQATQEDVFEHSGMKKLVEMALGGYAS